MIMKILKNKKIIFLLVGIIIFIIGLVLYFNNKKDGIVVDFATDQETFANEYESINYKKSEEGKEYPKVELDNNNIKYISIEEVLDILGTKDGFGVIYFGSASCIYCRSAVQVLVDTANKTELENIYYLDIEKIWNIKEVNKKGKVIETKKAHEKYDDLLKELGDEYITDYIIKDKNGKNIKLDEKRIAYPLVIFVSEGDIVSSWIKTVASHKDPYVSLNEEQIQSLSEIYRYGIRDVIKGKEVYEYNNRYNK